MGGALVVWEMPDYLHSTAKVPLGKVPKPQTGHIGPCDELATHSEI